MTLKDAHFAFKRQSTAKHLVKLPVKPASQPKNQFSTASLSCPKVGFTQSQSLTPVVITPLAARKPASEIT